MLNRAHLCSAAGVAGKRRSLCHELRCEARIAGKSMRQMVLCGEHMMKGSAQQCHSQAAQAACCGALGTRHSSSGLPQLCGWE